MGDFSSCPNRELCLLPDYENIIALPNSAIARNLRSAVLKEDEAFYDNGYAIARMAEPGSDTMCHVAVRTDEDDEDYWLMRVTKGLHVADATEARKSRDSDFVFPVGSTILCGHYYELHQASTKRNKLFYLDEGVTHTVFAHLIFHVGFELNKVKRGKTTLYHVGPQLNEELLGALESVAAT